MGKTSRWFRSLLMNKKEKEKGETQIIDLPTENRSATVPVPATKEKKMWSFRRSVGGAKDLNSPELSVTAPSHGLLESEIDQRRHFMVVAVATAAAADASVAAAPAAATILHLTTVANCRKTSTIEESAAIKIQSLFRSYLARKALCALKGLVKLQALVRGHLVRKQATATLRCMQALINVQTRARTQKIQNIESHAITEQQQSSRRPSHHRQLRQSFEMDRNDEEYFKFVEMDLGETRSNSKSRSSYSIAGTERIDHRFSTDINAARTPSKADPPVQFSPTPSALTEMSPEARSGHFEEFSFATVQSNPHLSAISMPTHISFAYPLYPNYMANTESSRAKARSQSEPKQRIDTYERQSSRRRPLVEGRNIPKGMKMQRSFSHVGLTASSNKYPWSIKLNKSNMSLKDSECGSTSTRLTNTNYCKSLVGYEIHGNNY